MIDPSRLLHYFVAMSNFTVSERQQQIVSEFKDFKTWEEKYKYIIRLGKELPEMPESDKREDLKVKGCQSQVWLKADLNDQMQVVFQADSDALIVKGLIALLLRVFSEQTPESILQSDVKFIEDIGLTSHLSASRTNGLQSMIKQIKYYAQAYDYLVKTTKGQ